MKSTNMKSTYLDLRDIFVNYTVECSEAARIAAPNSGTMPWSLVIRYKLVHRRDGGRMAFSAPLFLWTHDSIDAKARPDGLGVSHR
jgi:hypothetical protein